MGILHKIKHGAKKVTSSPVHIPDSTPPPPPIPIKVPKPKPKKVIEKVEEKTKEVEDGFQLVGEKIEEIPEKTNEVIIKPIETGFKEDIIKPIENIVDDVENTFDFSDGSSSKKKIPDINQSSSFLPLILIGGAVIGTFLIL